jgi:hypothetical protein
MKKYKKLNLNKLSIVKLTDTVNIIGGIITTNVSCGFLNTEGAPCITIGLYSCDNGQCNNKTHEFDSCQHQGTLETRTGDSLIKFTHTM